MDGGPLDEVNESSYAGFHNRSKTLCRMKYKVFFVESDEGFAVICPALPGCCSQGRTHEEALTNIREAIRLWLEVAEEDILRDSAGTQAVAEEVTI
jgi:predicted RNase H-like HicB family nuclease